MTLPRDLSGAGLAKSLKKLGDAVTRQKGSHIRMTTQQNGEHNVTIRDHDPVKIGTLAEFLKDVADHVGMQRDELLDHLFGYVNLTNQLVDAIKLMPAPDALKKGDLLAKEGQSKPEGNEVRDDV